MTLALPVGLRDSTLRLVAVAQALLAEGVMEIRDVQYFIDSFVPVEEVRLTCERNAIRNIGEDPEEEIEERNAASKFALTGLSEGLRAELAGDGFAVTTVCPGLMRTGSSYNAWFKGQHRQEFAWFHIADSLPGISISARRAARQIVDACRHGDPELVITSAARAAVLFNALSPTATASLMAAVNRVLPAPTQAEGDEARSGWQSVSRVAPSRLTTLADRASIENNELPSHPHAR